MGGQPQRPFAGADNLGSQGRSVQSVAVPNRPGLWHRGEGSATVALEEGLHGQANDHDAKEIGQQRGGLFAPESHTLQRQRSRDLSRGFEQ